MNAATIAARLRAAADHIERVGWIQGDFYQDYQKKRDSPCCVVGAIQVVSPRSMAPESALGRHLQEALVARWNDDDGRTQAEVTAAMRACADNLDAES